MKRKLILLGGILAAANLAQATTIDFNNLADGTRASGLYDGILSIEAGGGFARRELVNGLIETHEDFVFDGIISDGKIASLPLALLPHDLLPGSGYYHSLVSGTFLEPVTDLRLDVHTWDYPVSVLYTGVTSQGFSFTTSFMAPTMLLLLPQTLILASPPGGYLTGFSLDPGADSKAGDAFVSVDNISFRRVPEGGSAWLLMAFASGVLLCLRPKSA